MSREPSEDFHFPHRDEAPPSYRSLYTTELDASCCLPQPPVEMDERDPTELPASFPQSHEGQSCIVLQDANALPWTPMRPVYGAVGPDGPRFPLDSDQYSSTNPDMTSDAYTQRYSPVSPVTPSSGSYAASFDNRRYSCFSSGGSSQNIVSSSRKFFPMTNYMNNQMANNNTPYSSESPMAMTDSFPSSERTNGSFAYVSSSSAVNASNFRNISNQVYDQTTVLPSRMFQNHGSNWRRATDNGSAWIPRENSVTQPTTSRDLSATTDYGASCSRPHDERSFFSNRQQPPVASRSEFPNQTLLEESRGQLEPETCELCGKAFNGR